METAEKQQNKISFVIRLFPEITIKSPPVRKRWTKLLSQNIRVLARQVEPKAAVVQEWDKITVKVPCNSANIRETIVDTLARIPGIANFSEVKTYPFESLQDVYEKTFDIWSQALAKKTFCVRVKRSGSNHDFSSIDAEAFIGGELNQNAQTGGVSLKNPDVTVRIDIKEDVYAVSCSKYEGLGGFPLGTQEPVMSLVSGGFDSTVASYQMIKRGMRTHYCFFNLGGRAHELAVKEISYFLWKKYGSSHRVKFISVPFEGVINEIMEKISPANMGVVLKRMMLRAGEKVAARGGIQAMVTGEAISQVSSQTIPNLAVIDKSTDMLVLRPLIASAKTDIIKCSREIGVEEFNANVPEYCGVISVKPSAKVNVERLLEEEQSFDFSVLDSAISDCCVQSIDQVMKEPKTQSVVEVVEDIPLDGVVIDIRHPDESDLKPLVIENNEILHIPFYKLNNAFENIAEQRSYYLYCDRGVMSHLHATHLHDMGFANIRVYRPKK